MDHRDNGLRSDTNILSPTFIADLMYDTASPEKSEQQLIVLQAGELYFCEFYKQISRMKH